MTAHELARKLLEGPDLMVTRRGYEGGVMEIDTINEPEYVCLNVHDEWYYGKHEYSCYDEPCQHEKVKAIHIE